MYQEITAVQYRRLVNTCPVVCISSMDGSPVNNGVAVMEEAWHNQQGAVFYTAFRKENQYYFAEANLKRGASNVIRFRKRKYIGDYKACSALKLIALLH